MQSGSFFVLFCFKNFEGGLKMINEEKRNFDLGSLCGG